MTVSRRQTARTTGAYGPLWTVMLGMLVMPGCKTGAATSKPAWWAFSGGDSAKLASAPAYGKGGIEKPSATAKPYPVTSTPQPYSLAAAASPPAAASSADVAAIPPAVTYGTTPAARPQASPSPAVQEMARAPHAGQPAPLASITPQVGPYTNLPGEPAAAAGSAAEESANRFRAAPPERFADARPSDSWTAPAASPQPPPTGSRHGDPAGGRFAGPPPADVTDQLSQPMARPAGFTAVDPPAAVTTPPEVPPGAMPGSSLSPALPAPPAFSPSPSPSAPVPVPSRRPDPMYRPGGTSNYRPNRDILVGGNPGSDAAVRQVNFEAPQSPN